ncbi:uncharacterized protein LOC113204125 [Frankliniella occidentalis]|uniref:Uncharacterized protein LOC113204125 n=1 Tax=Frankliniella occidentalis TaxID=133901 RepID=A0A9C6TUT2_FRAOC|nr:uncharacterized protein LOC113204125 [Frankliniella occidentalis]
MQVMRRTDHPQLPSPIVARPSRPAPTRFVTVRHIPYFVLPRGRVSAVRRVLMLVSSGPSLPRRSGWSRCPPSLSPSCSPAEPRRGRLPSCEEQADEEDEDDPEPPGVAAAAATATPAPVDVDVNSALPDVVPRAAPRQSLSRQPRWPASPFTKYITASSPGLSSQQTPDTSPFSSAPVPLPTSPSSNVEDEPQVREAVASSATTLCYRLPDVVCDAERAAPCPAPRTAPRPSPALGPALGVAHLTPKPAPRWHRPRAALKCPAPAAVPRALREDELEHALCKMAEGDSWLRVGQHLRNIADQLHLPDEVDGPAGPAEPPARPSGLLSLLLPQPAKHKRTFLTTAVVLLVGWRLLSRVR